MRNKIISALTALAMAVSLCPAPALAAEGAGEGDERVFHTEDLNTMTDPDRYEAAQTDAEGKLRIHTSVRALVGKGVSLAVIPIDDELYVQLADLADEAVSAQVSGVNGTFSYQWGMKGRPADSDPDTPYEDVVVGGSAASGAGVPANGQSVAIALPLADQSLSPNYEYIFTVTVTDDATGDVATAEVLVEVGRYVRTVSAPMDAVWPDGDAWAVGKFVHGAVLGVDGTLTEDTIPADAKRAFESAAEGCTIPQMWQLTLDAVTDPDGAEQGNQKIDEIYLSISPEEYQRIVDGDAKVIGFEGSPAKAVTYEAHPVRELVEGSDPEAPEYRYFVRIEKSGEAGDLTVGTYALAVKGEVTAKVTARVEGTGGQVSDAGEHEWSLQDVWGNPLAPTYTFVSFPDFELASVTLRDSLGKQLFNYPESELTGEGSLALDMLEDEGTYELIVTFAPIQTDPEADPVSLSASVVDDQGAPVASGVTLKGTGTLQDEEACEVESGNGQLAMSGLLFGARAEVAFHSSTWEVLVAEVSVDGGATWKPAGLVGNACVFDSLKGDALVRFTAKHSETQTPPVHYDVAAAIVDEDGNIVAQSDADGVARDEHGNQVALASLSVPDMGTADADISCAPNHTVGEVYALAGGVRTDLSAVLSGSDEAGWQVAPYVMGEDLTVCVRMAPYTAYYLRVGRGGSVSLNGETPKIPIKVVQGGQPQKLHVQADTASKYVIDRSKCAGISFGSASGAISAIDAPLPFAGAKNTTLEVAFKKDTSGSSDYITVEVTVTVESTTGGRTMHSGEQALVEGEGGLVTPTHVLLKRNSPYSFYIFPFDGFNVENVMVTSEPAAGETTEQPIERDELTLITDETFQEVVNAEGQHAVMQGLATQSLREMPHGDEVAEDEVVYGYELYLDSIDENLQLNVNFAEDPNAHWGELDTAAIGASEGGLISPVGEMKIPQGHAIQMELTVLPDDGWRLTHLWKTEDGKTEDVATSDLEDGGTTMVSLKKGTKVYAEFEPISVVIDVDDDVEHGAISPDGKQRVIPGTSNRFYFWADDGYALESVHLFYPDDPTDYGWSVEPGTYCIDMDDFEEGMFLSATFAPGETPKVDTATLTVDGAAQDDGSAAVTGGRVWPAEQKVELSFDDQGRSATTAAFYYMAESRYMLESVVARGVDGKEMDPAHVRIESGVFYIDGVTGPLTVVPAFKEIRFVVVSLDLQIEGGHLDAQDTLEGTLVVLAGTPVDVNVVADSGYVLDGVPEYIEDPEDEQEARPFNLLALLAGGQERTPSSVEYKDGVATVHPFANGTLTARFKPAPSVENPPDTPGGPGNTGNPSDSGNAGTETPGNYDFYITATAGEHGKISPAGRVGVNRGQSRTFTFTADTNYMVASVTVDGKEVQTSADQYTFKKVDGTHTIHVEFKAKRTITMISSVDRTVHRLQSLAATGLTSLAATGDLVAPIVIALIGLACAGGGIALLGRGRSRRKAAEER